MEAITKIFTTEDKEELRQAFKEMIKDQFKNDLEQNDNYLFDSSEIEIMINEAFEEVISKIKNEFEEKLKEQMLKFFDNNVHKLFTKAE